MNFFFKSRHQFKNSETRLFLWVCVGITDNLKPFITAVAGTVCVCVCVCAHLHACMHVC